MLVLALLVAAAVSGLPKVQREKVVAVFEVASQIIFRVIRLIMWAAPIGAFGGMAFTVAKFGGTSLTSLGVLMATFWGTCAVFVFGVLGPGRAHIGLLDLPPHPADPRRAADHPRHLLVGDRAAAAAGQAPSRGRLASASPAW